ncbi:heme ABC exporter ATP-binding subunit CcmA [Bradyrhizobium sp. USDA 4449]
MNRLVPGQMQLSGRGVTCVRGGREVFSGLDFEAASGTAVAVVGRNGSGKTSLLRLIAGLLIPAGGTIVLDGGDADVTLPEQCHYLGHRDALKPALSVAENLSFWADFLGGERFDAAASLAAVGLDHAADLPASFLSAGQRRRLSLARLLAVRRPGLAAGRADHGAGCRRPGDVRRPDAGASGGRRPDHRGDAWAAGDRGAGAADRGNGVRRQDPQLFERLSAAFSVPSPLVGKGQGGGRRTGTLTVERSSSLLPSAPFPGLPLSPALPHKGGGSAVCPGHELGSHDHLSAEANP